jgi:hypothetical protein
MAEAVRKSDVEKPSSTRRKTASRKPRSRTGGNATKRAGTRASRKKRTTAKDVEDVCVDGAGQLRDAANLALAKQSSAIADNLAKKAAHGNTTCAKLLVDWTAGKMPEPRKVKRGSSLAQELNLEPAWKEEPQEAEVAIGAGNAE